MNKLILAGALLVTAAFTTTAFAAATLANKDSTSNGSAVGQSSSSFTGNGAAIGGNGSMGTTGAPAGTDETNAPGSRVNTAGYGVHSINTPPGQGGSTPPGQVGK